jgi:hypothetical protein
MTFRTHKIEEKETNKQTERSSCKKGYPWSLTEKSEQISSIPSRISLSFGEGEIATHLNLLFPVCRSVSPSSDHKPPARKKTPFSSTGSFGVFMLQRASARKARQPLSLP